MHVLVKVSTSTGGHGQGRAGLVVVMAVMMGFMGVLTGHRRATVADDCGEGLIINPLPRIVMPSR